MSQSKLRALPTIHGLATGIDILVTHAAVACRIHPSVCRERVGIAEAVPGSG